MLTAPGGHDAALSGDPEAVLLRVVGLRVDQPVVATGEHEALVRGAEPFMRDRLADIWQADVTWAGGITEMKKIAGLALASGTRIVPHYGYTPWAAHFILACQASPMIEWYDMTADLPPLRSLAHWESP